MNLPSVSLPWLTVAFFAVGGGADAWTPGTGSPTAAQGFVVDVTNRSDVLSFYNTIYAASENYPADMAWTGSTGSGVAGTTSSVFKDDLRRRINFYRALGGLPGDITFDAVKSSGAQDAALMMSRNNALSHMPPNSWVYWTTSGSNAAAKSNLSLGIYGADAVNGYMRDDGTGNQLLGHRRWLMYSRAQSMGTGDVPQSGSYSPANAIWVTSDFKTAPAPAFVAWPNRGFSPFPLMPARWSLSYPGANFAGAAVTMTQGGNNVSVTIVSRTDNGYGDNTLVWEPSGMPSSISADKPYNVSVTGITGAGIPTSYSYTVTLFDPNVLGDLVTISGTSTPPASAATYTFNSIAQADAYKLDVAKGSAAVWLEGAEDSPVPQISQVTTGSYALRQTAVKRTGSKAFQLAFPDPADQSFQVLRDVIPSATSQLQFYDLGRFATTTTTLGAEISADGGNTWASVFSRNGVGNNSANWDKKFLLRSISLSAYAGQIIRVRFILRRNGGSYIPDTTSTSGFFIDDVTVNNATELANATVTSLAGSGTSFNLNAATAGAPLVVGTSYYLRIAPKVGTRWFGYGAAKIVTAQALTGYQAWIASQYPSVTEGAAGDHEKDGISNGAEYAFGLNPMLANPASAIPKPSKVGSTYRVTFTQPAGITGVTYGAKWSRNLVDWFPISDTGGGGTTHTFSISTVNEPKIFFRHVITVAP